MDDFIKKLLNSETQANVKTMKLTCQVFSKFFPIFFLFICSRPTKSPPYILRRKVHPDLFSQLPQKRSEKNARKRFFSRKKLRAFN